MCARAFFRGSAHILVEADDEMARMTGCNAIGLPAREVYIGPTSAKHQRLMDAVYRGEMRAWAGDIDSVDGVPGRLVIARWADGVACEWRALAADPVLPSALLPVHPGLPRPVAASTEEAA